MDVRLDLQQWQELNSDLGDVTSWLGSVLPELERLQSIAPSASVQEFEVNIRKLKVRMLNVWQQDNSASCYHNNNYIKVIQQIL